MYTREKLKLHNIFFDRIISELGLGETNGDVVAVLHILPDAIPLTRALARIAKIKGIIPKPKSIDARVMSDLNELPIYRSITRETSFNLMEGITRRTAFMDIGGYFSKYAKDIQMRYEKYFAGIVEDTENGLQKYLKTGIDFPFISVARSPLKYNEDIMVGQAIVYSVESILREHGLVINGLNIGVIGYGKIGASVAQNFKQRQGKVSIFDINNVRLTHSISAGFDISDKSDLLSHSDVLCLATGNLSLSGSDYQKIKKGAWVFSVTSSDDELDKTWLEKNYEKEQLSRHVMRYSNGEHYFYLLNKGDTINFVHGTTVGDFILLVHAELLVAVHTLLTNIHNEKDYKINDKIRDKICKIWIETFRRKDNRRHHVIVSPKNSRLHINAVATLKKYAETYPDEGIDLLMHHVECAPNSIYRSHIPGHLTASGLVIHNNRVLLIHHNVLQKFLQPGGHLEDSDVSLYESAKREILEETGLHVEAHPQFGSTPIHVAIHKIPANKERGEPDHLHYDCMFVFSVGEIMKDLALQREEVSAYRWVPLNYDFKDRELSRAIEKIRNNLSKNNSL